MHITSADILQQLADQDLLSQLARHLGIRPQAINPWRREGRIPAGRIPGVVAFLVAHGLAMDPDAATQAMALGLLPDELAMKCSVCGLARATNGGLCRNCRPDRCGAKTTTGRPCCNPSPCRHHPVAS